jgi:hypothetical protein
VYRPVPVERQVAAATVRMFKRGAFTYRALTRRQRLPQR